MTSRTTLRRTGEQSFGSRSTIQYHLPCQTTSNIPTATSTCCRGRTRSQIFQGCYAMTQIPKYRNHIPFLRQRRCHTQHFPLLFRTLLCTSKQPLKTRDGSYMTALVACENWRRWSRHATPPSIKTAYPTPRSEALLVGCSKESLAAATNRIRVELAVVMKIRMSW